MGMFKGKKNKNKNKNKKKDMKDVMFGDSVSTGNHLYVANIKDVGFGRSMSTVVGVKGMDSLSKVSENLGVTVSKGDTVVAPTGSFIYMEPIIVKTDDVQSGSSNKDESDKSSDKDSFDYVADVICGVPLNRIISIHSVEKDEKGKDKVVEKYSGEFILVKYGGATNMNNMQGVKYGILEDIPITASCLSRKGLRIEANSLIKYCDANETLVETKDGVFFYLIPFDDVLLWAPLDKK